MRILIVVTHLLGVGHLARAAALGRAFKRAGHDVLLISGGRPAPAIDVSGLKVIQLPPVHVIGTDFRSLYQSDDQYADEKFLDGRAACLIDAATAFQPDAAIIELFPFGRRQLKDEFLALVAALRQPPFRVALVSSIRDVLTPPSTEAKIRQSEAWVGLFDRVLVHSDPAVMPLEQTWPVSAALAHHMSYTGYVSDVRAAAREPGGGIVVSAGGSATGLPLLNAALEASRGDARHWHLLVGHALPETMFSMLRDRASSNVTVERARKDFPALLARAACSVSQFGYNTALDLAAAGIPAVVVPYDEGKEVEQTIRAARFAAMGLVEHLPAALLSPQSLLAAIARALARGAGRWPLETGGAETAVAMTCAAVEAKRADAAAWQALIDALDTAARAGRSVRFWWRDDDACAPSDALDRLLALRSKLGVPLALAVVPARAGEGLAQRLREEEDLTVLVHGVAHRNAAAPGGKKQELLAADEPTLASLKAALERCQRLFGGVALPVLVPPWNRIAPEIVSALPGLGFAGWSGMADGDGAGPAPGALHVHVDPIDWKAGGGLRPAGALLTRLARVIETQGLDGPPIGLLTHHLQHDPWIWTFAQDLLTLLCRHRAVRFVTAGSALGLTGATLRGRQAG